MASSIIGIFLGIFFLPLNIDTSVRIAAAILVGVVGVISFVRHSIFSASDQVRMGWRQDHKEFQVEVGFANLAIGIWALVAAALGWGVVCGVMLMTYGTYLLCAFLLHVHQAGIPGELHDPALRSRAFRSSISTGFFVLALFAFGILGLARAGVLPFLSM